MAHRAIVFAVDGLILPLIDHLIDQGRLPHLARMFREGAVSRVLPFISTWGPINFFSLATGAAPGLAWQGTQSVPGMDHAEGGQRGIYAAETLWQAVERAGRSSVLISYPGCWPPNIRRGVIAVPDPSGTNLGPVHIARPARYMTPSLAERYRQPAGTRAGWIPLSARGREPQEPPPLARPAPPTDWVHVPFDEALATTVPIRGHGEILDELGLLLYRMGDAWEGVMCRDKNGDQMLTHLEPGQWSNWVPLAFEEEGGLVRFKLLEVSEDGRELALCHSQVYPLAEFAYPRGVETDLIEAVGPYASDSSADLRPSDPFWPTAIEEATYEADWLVRASAYLAQRDDWALFMTVFRPPDQANHGCLAFLDPTLPHYDPASEATALEILAQAYGVVDGAIGAWMDAADDETVIALISDHGAMANHVTCDIYSLLVEHGLLALEEHGGRYEVDWERTRAYIRPDRSASEIFINLDGREPHGIVPPEEYETLQRQIIDLLLDWREPETGARAIALALSKRDAALVGYWGENSGDVQFIYNEGFVWGELPLGQTIARTTIPSVNHGPQAPTAERGLASNMGMLALWGEGVRRGYRRPEATLGPVRMSDPAPTLAHLLGIDPPRQSEGAVLRDMVE